MNPIICQAIKNRNLLSFIYEGLPRIVEPHAYGISAAENPVLRAFQVDGQSIKIELPNWGLFLESGISNLEILPAQFIGPRPGYKKGDKGMKIIFCEL